MRFARIYLGVLGFGLVVIGALFLAQPVVWAEWVDIFLPTATARTDLRATYGGFHAGFGLFLMFCARRPDWLQPGLWAAVLALAGFAAGRLLGFLVEGTVIPRLLILFAIETIGTALGAVALHRLAVS